MFYKKSNLCFMLFCCSIVLLTACDKISDELPESSSTEGQFLNLNKGSSWNYSLNGADTFTVVTASDSSKPAFNKVYTVFHNLYLGSVTRSYFTYRLGNYYSLITNTPGVYEEVVYLKDSMEIGKKWNSTVLIGGNPYLHEYEVLENNLSITVNGTEFKQVVHVKLKVTSTGYSSDCYYAPKIGLIKNAEIIGGNSFVSEIRGYTLK